MTAITADEMTEEQREERIYLKNALEYAPKSPGKQAANLRGWWTPLGWYLCAACAGRIMARGCGMPRGSEPVWTDRPEPYGTCVTCGE